MAGRWDTTENPDGQVITQVLVTRTLTADGDDVITVQSEPDETSVLERVGLLTFAAFLTQSPDDA